MFIKVSMRQFLSLWLSLSIVLTSPAMLMATEAHARQPKPHKPSTANSTANISPKDKATAILREYSDALYSGNPMMEAFLKSELPEGHSSGFTLEDPMLDSNPFFVRGQKWDRLAPQDIQSLTSGENDDSNKGIYSQIVNGKTELALVSSQLKLTLPLPLNVVLDGNEFLFFTLSKSSDLFEKVSDEDMPSQGFFYMSKHELYNWANMLNSGAPTQFARVPIYFFALPDSGWQGELDAFEWMASDSIVLFNNEDGVPLPISLIDLREHLKHGKLNYTLSKLSGLVSKWDQLENVTLEDIVGALPAKGSTAGFGTFLTGLDLDQPNFKLWARGEAKQQSFKNYVQNLLVPQSHAGVDDAVGALVETVGTLIDPRIDSKSEKSGKTSQSGEVTFKDKFARPNYGKPKTGDEEPDSRMKKLIKHAETGAMVGLTGYMAYLSSDYLSVIDSKDMERIWFLSKIIGTTFAASVLIKYSIYRDKFKEKYKVGETKAEKRSDLVGKLARGAKHSQNELKGIFDVFAHSLTTVSKFIPVTIINTLEYIGDRFATKASSPKNALLRKGFMYTMGFMRTTVQNLAVNWKTWFLGAIIMGITVDAMLVAVQLVVVLPALAVMSGLQTEAQAYEFKNNPNSNMNSFVTAEVIRNVVDYIRGGADGYSAEQRMLVTDRVNHYVDKLMAGKDPKDENYARVREKLFESEMEKAMKLRGLPGKEEFIFDSRTLLHKILSFLGYSVAPLVGDISVPDNFLFQSGRWGIVRPSLKKAISQGQNILKTKPSPVGEQAIEFLKSMDQRWSYVLGFAKNYISLNLTREAFIEAKRVRQILTLLSYGGDVKTVVKFLPEWVKDLGYSEEVLVAAARLYNNSIYSIVEGDNEISELKDITEFQLYNALNITPSLRNDRQDLSLDHEKLKKLVTVSGNSGNGDTTAKELTLALEELQKEKNGDAFYDHLVQQRSLKLIQAAIKRKADLESFKPEKDGWFTRWQKSRAHHNTQVRLAEEMAKPENAVAATPQEEISTLITRMKKLYAEELSRVVGLKVQSNTDFFKKVEAETEEAFNNKIQNPGEAKHIEELGAEKRDVYLAEIYGELFLENYKQLSVHTDEHLDPFSAQQPGVFQGWRVKLNNFVGRQTEKLSESSGWKKVKSKIAIGSSKVINKSLRATEAFWSTHSNELGFKNWVYRNIPFTNDFFTNLSRSLRTWPYFFSFGYLAYYHIWQVTMAYPMWLMAIASGVIGLMFVEFNNRGMQNFGIKPMEGIKQKFYYAHIHSWLTMFAFLPMILYGEQFSNAFYENVRDPMYNFFGNSWESLKGLGSNVRDVVSGQASTGDFIQSAHAGVLTTAGQVSELASQCARVLVQ